MPPSDKIVSFGKPSPAASAPPSAEEPDETLLAVEHLAKFLLDNKATIHNFVCGVATRETPDGDDIFHLLTSPIEAAEYALSLHLMEDGLRRRLHLLDN
jgi:hypothetical protein